MTKHTPAPWTVNDGEYHGGFCIRADSRRDDEHNAVVALVGMEGAPEHIQAENEANARLIAAAPELLQRLELLLNLAEIDCMDDKSNEWRNEMIYSRAAIAKARGEA